jgi:hypothetical protein
MAHADAIRRLKGMGALLIKGSRVTPAMTPREKERPPDNNCADKGYIEQSLTI